MLHATICTDDAFQQPVNISLNIDAEKLVKYLRNQTQSLLFASINEVKLYQFTHGQSNPTYLIQVDSQRFVLRKQPPGKLLKGAHQVIREARLLSFLREHSSVPVPTVHVICEDASIIGTSFYIMDHISGTIYIDPSLPTLSRNDRAVVYESLVRVLAAIHAVTADETPLAKSESRGFERNRYSRSGIPNSGDTYTQSTFCSKQVAIWMSQYAKSAELSGDIDERMQRLGDWLLNNASSNESPWPHLVHGDFRLDNIIFDSAQPSRVLAVIDWELATLGAPIADLAYCCMGHHLPPIGFLKGMSLLGRNTSSKCEGTAVALPDGIPNEREIIDAYTNATRNSSGMVVGADSTIEEITEDKWKFFLGLGFFRAAAIASGVYARSISGNASRGNMAVVFKNAVPLLASEGLKIVGALESSVVDHSCQRTKSNDHKSISSNERQIVSKSLTVASAPLVFAGAASFHGVSSPLSQLCRELLRRLRDFNDTIVIPAEKELIEYYTNAPGAWPDRGDRWVIHPRLEELSKQAWDRGLWNLWIPGHLAAELKQKHPHWDWSSLLPHGRGLTHLEYAYLAMESGRSLFCAEAINCSAPDTGNMEIIAKFGSKHQREYWLLPLLRGKMRSCFGMTEPSVASSDPTQLKSTAVLEGMLDDTQTSEKYQTEEEEAFWVINGQKWWTTGANDPRCKVCIFVALTDTTVNSSATNKKSSLSSSVSSAPPHRRHSFFLVPMGSPGISVRRPLTVFGYDDAPHGHAEVVFNNVRVFATKRDNGSSLSRVSQPPEGLSIEEYTAGGLIGEMGGGFALAQARLGPGRLHHCARLVGHGERGIEEIIRRGSTRRAFGKTLLDLGGNAGKLAQGRIALRLAKLAVLDAAVELDSCDASHDAGSSECDASHDAGSSEQVGSKENSASLTRRLSDSAISALAVAKVATPKALEQCLDFAIQIHGGGGLSNDHPLAAMWCAARTLRLVDGADEVHLRTLAKTERARVVKDNVEGRPGEDEEHRRLIKESGLVRVEEVHHPGTGRSRL